eukprot:g6921.t1
MTKQSLKTALEKRGHTADDLKELRTRPDLQEALEEVLRDPSVPALSVDEVRTEAPADNESAPHVSCADADRFGWGTTAQALRRKFFSGARKHSVAVAGIASADVDVSTAWKREEALQRLTSVSDLSSKKVSKTYTRAEVS